MIHSHTTRPRAPTLMALLLPALVAQAGDLTPPAAPNDAGSAMYDLSDLYNRLNSGAVGAKRGDTFAEPASGPGDTMHSLDAIMGKMPVLNDTDGATDAEVVKGKTFWGLRSGGGWGELTGTRPSAPVAKTGQTECDDEDGNSVPDCTGTGQDGELKEGVAWPTTRFTDNSNGTVTDNLTGLIWLTKANCIGTDTTNFDNDGTTNDGKVTWQHALDFVAAINDGTYSCGTSNTDSDWRLPNLLEMQSLIDYGENDPALPYGYPFTDPVNYYYWTSTTRNEKRASAWIVGVGAGFVSGNPKSYKYSVWPVRGGQ